MYSNERNVQITLSLLKQREIRHVVLSPGGSDAPVVKSFENDNFFTCYSVVDERSSVFFGIGLAQELNQAVVCVCTSGTAVSNFLTGMTEAYYQNVPIIAITTDSHSYNLNQLELQKLNQDDIFRDVVKFEASLPVVKTDMDEWHCNRLVNEALLELYHRGTGPIHINIPITQTLECNTQILPYQRVINRYDIQTIDYKKFTEVLKDKKVLVIVGQNTNIYKSDLDILNAFYRQYNCVYSVETVSNLKCSGCICTYPLTETFLAYNKQELIPDIVISLGNFVASYMLKPLLRSNRNSIQNWLVIENGAVRDPYWCLSDIIEGNGIEFIKGLINKEESEEVVHTYYDSWKNIYNSIQLGDLGFSSFSIAKLLSEKMPDNSVLHTAILNSTRLMQFFPPKNHVTCYTNLGALGIDGCTPTAIGHSMASKKLTYLLTGDLSFFYGMNALGIRGLKSNLRVILFNNGGGEEFKIKLNLPDIDKYVCACSNHRIAKGWVESLGFKYFTASSNDEIGTILDDFAQESDVPMFLEVFLNIDKDSEIIRNVYSINKPKKGTIDILKSAAVKLLPESVINQLTKIK